MMEMLKDITEFHNKFGIYPNEDIDFKLRFDRLLEELNEFDDAYTPWDKLDALVDACYIAMGTLYLYESHYANTVFACIVPFAPWASRPLPEINPTLPNLRWLVTETSLEDHMTGCWWLIQSILQWCALNRWDFPEAWDRVHKANMAKERATCAEDSKHGSAQDIIKPEGWTAPDHRDLFEVTE